MHTTYFKQLQWLASQHGQPVDTFATQTLMLTAIKAGDDQRLPVFLPAILVQFFRENVRGP